VKTMLPLREVSAETGIPYDTLWHAAAPRGDLPVVRVGNGRGAIYVKREDLDAWIAKRRIAPVDEKAIVRAHTRHSWSDERGADRFG
jgi:hypothetical protein